MIDPHETPDMAAAMDTPLDQFRQLAMESGFCHSSVKAAVELLQSAIRAGIVQQLVEAECQGKAAHELLKRILGIIGDGENCRLRVYCLDFLAGTNVFGGLSETDIALRFGYTRSNVSYIVKDLQRQLKVNEPIGGKSEQAVEQYRTRARRNHADGKLQRKQQNWPGATYFA